MIAAAEMTHHCVLFILSNVPHVGMTAWQLSSLLDAFL